MNSLVVNQCYKNPSKKSTNPAVKKFTAGGKFCPNCLILGNITSSSNFLKHVQEQHPEEFQKFETLKAQVGLWKRKRVEPL
jgi:hypothetical protein